MKFRTLKRRLASMGIVWHARRGKGSHGAFAGPSRKDRTRQVAFLPKAQQQEVSIVYPKSICRAFEIDLAELLPGRSN